jgi:predicted small secreted protein
MKKTIRVALVFTLVVATMFVLAGCGGGNTTQAKKYMKAGDDLMQKLMTQATEWQNEMSSLGNFSNPAEFQASVDKAKSLGAQVSKTGEEATAEYKKINGLSDVSDYKKYADLRIAELAVIQKMIQKFNEFMDKSVAMVNSGDSTGLTNLQQQVTQEINSLSSEGQKLDTEASKLKTDKKL